MKAMIVKWGGAYLVYEIVSTLLLVWFAAQGFEIPGY